MPRLWIDTVFNSVVVIGTQKNVLLTAPVTATQARLQQMTLLRTIIGFDLARTVHDSGEGSERISIGIGIGREGETAAENVPAPNDGAEFPTRGWVWRASYRIFGFAADQPAIFSRRVDLDLRSQRKLENGESFLAARLEAIDGSNSTVNIVGMVRQLWLVG